MNHIPLSILAASLTVFLAGCNEKPKAEQLIEKAKTSAQVAGAAIKDAAQRTGNVVGDTAEKVWEVSTKGYSRLAVWPPTWPARSKPVP